MAMLHTSLTACLLICNVRVLNRKQYRTIGNIWWLQHHKCSFSFFFKCSFKLKTSVLFLAAVQMKVLLWKALVLFVNILWMEESFFGLLLLSGKKCFGSVHPAWGLGTAGACPPPAVTGQEVGYTLERGLTERDRKQHSLKSLDSNCFYLRCSLEKIHMS